MLRCLFRCLFQLFDVHALTVDAGTAAEIDDARSFSGQRHSCRQYAVLVDDGRPDEVITLCGGLQRVTDAYLSTGSTLQVRITAGLAPNDFQRFVIAYTGLC